MLTKRQLLPQPRYAKLASLYHPRTNDLLEGLQDLLDAETDIQRKLAIAQLGGNLSKLYEGWRKELLHCLAHIEAVIDFADDEDDVDNNLMDVVTRRVRVLIQSIKSHLHDHNKGEILRNGIHIALIGPPNVGIFFCI